MNQRTRVDMTTSTSPSRLSPLRILKQHPKTYWLYTNRDNKPIDRKYCDCGHTIRALLQRANELSHDSTIKTQFAALLDDCERFLHTQAFYQLDDTTTPASVVRIFWEPSIQCDVDTLLAQVRADTQRLGRLHSTSSHTLQDSQQASPSRRPLQTHPARPVSQSASPASPQLDDYVIPPGVVLRLRTASTRLPPPGYVSHSEFSLQSGIDNLRSHLSKSTIQASYGQPQSIEQHLSLLKAQWLLQTVKAFPAVRHMLANDPVMLQLADLEHQIVLQRARNDLTSYDPSQVESLPTNHFFIWPERSQNIPRDQMQPIAGRERVLMDNIDLPCPRGFSACKLRVFRDLESKRGTTIRVTRQWTKNDQPLPPHTSICNSYTQTLRPVYLSPTLAHGQPFGVEITSPSGSGSEMFEFATLEDVFKFQWAMTSYAVFSDFLDVDWAIARTIKSTLKGRGSRLQMWWYDPDDQLEKVAAEATAPSSKDTGHATIQTRMTGDAGRAVLGESRSLDSSATLTRISENTDVDIVEALPPYEPLLIVYNITEKSREYICLKLHGRMFLDASACNCAKRPTSCLRSVIKSSNIGKCEVKRVALAASSSRQLPNLNVFARPCLKGVEPHPDWNAAEDISARELILDFASARERQKFNQQFEFIIKLQRARESTQEILEKRAEFLSNRARGNSNVKERIMGAADTIEAMSAIVTPASLTFYHPEFTENSHVRNGQRQSTGSFSSANASIVRVSTASSASSGGTTRSDLRHPLLSTSPVPPMNTWDPHAPYDTRSRTNSSASTLAGQLTTHPSQSNHRTPSIPSTSASIPIVNVPPDSRPHSYIPPRPSSIELDASTPRPVIAELDGSAATSSLLEPPYVPSIIAELDGLQISARQSSSSLAPPSGLACNGHGYANGWSGRQ